jgi:hypothetical protein
VAQRVGRGIALLFHDRGTRRGWGVSSTPRLHFTPGKDPVPILQQAGWAPGPVWTGVKSRPYRNSIPDDVKNVLQSKYQILYAICEISQEPFTFCTSLLRLLYWNSWKLSVLWCEFVMLKGITSVVCDEIYIGLCWLSVHNGMSNIKLISSSFNFDARWEWLINATLQATVPPGNDPLPIVEWSG